MAGSTAKKVVVRRFDRETGQVVVLYTPNPEDRFGDIPPIAFAPQAATTPKDKTAHTRRKNTMRPLAQQLSQVG